MQVAVHFHARISGGAHPASRHGPATPPINRAHAISVVTEQVDAMRRSGLLDAASEFVVGLNGDMDDYRTMLGICSPCTLVLHGPESAGELNTFAYLQKWLKSNPGCHVLYLHTKGVSWPGDALRQAWRRCLMRCCVWNWEQCLVDLGMGYEMVGGHWLTPAKFPQYARALGNGIWGGNFWLAQWNYLSRLKPVPTSRDWGDKYDAEMWPVSGNPEYVKDYCAHWPNLVDCGKAPP